MTTGSPGLIQPWYHFVRNNPALLVDPDGRAVFVWDPQLHWHTAGGDVRQAVNGVSPFLSLPLAGIGRNWMSPFAFDTVIAVGARNGVSPFGSILPWFGARNGISPLSLGAGGFSGATGLGGFGGTSAGVTLAWNWLIGPGLLFGSPTGCYYLSPKCWSTKIVVKSFINIIGKNIGVIKGGNNSIQDRLQRFANGTDEDFHENPTFDAYPDSVRLYSQKTFKYCCQDGKISGFVLLKKLDDTGAERITWHTSGGLMYWTYYPPAGTWYNEDQTIGVSDVKFQWGFKGRPNAFLEEGIQEVWPRTSKYIWHFVNGSLECDGQQGKHLVTIRGSGFPSHKLWVNTDIEQLIEQGPLVNLWLPDLADPTMVREDPTNKSTRY